MKRKKKRKGSYSQRELAKLCGCDRASVRKWLEAEGMKEPYGEEAIEAIERHQVRGESQDCNIDPETGLTWFQAKQKEEALKLRRRNEIEERAKGDAWVSSEKHLQVIAFITGRLEQLPGKAKSQLGLDGRQGSELQRMVDEVRADAAKDIEAL